MARAAAIGNVAQGYRYHPDSSVDFYDAGLQSAGLFLFC
jgi:hypothetical protein